MMLLPFQFARTPHIHFGGGCAAQLETIVARFNGPVLAVTGRSAMRSHAWARFALAVHGQGRVLHHALLTGEPSPAFVDQTSRQHHEDGISVVIGWGGGSVVDAGKAVSAMLPRNEPVADYLEDIGTQRYLDGRKIPYVAVPTTAGTGSEATKNAVLSRIGADGYKKSIRHDNFVPDFAVVDPELAADCPPAVTAACGMDTLTQLIEAYVSPQATPMTDALALSGIEAVARCLDRAVRHGQKDIDARTGMAYAALLSGMVLANAGLGIVHGLASPIGGLYEIPHGVVCGTLIAAATETNLRRLCELGDPRHPALLKYARVGATMVGKEAPDLGTGGQWLLERLWALTGSLKLPRLGQFGIDESGLARILDGTANKNNPIRLDRADIERLLRSRL